MSFTSNHGLTCTGPLSDDAARISDGIHSPRMNIAARGAYSSFHQFRKWEDDAELESLSGSLSKVGA